MDWLLTDGEGGLVLWWLLFAGCNVLRGAHCLVRDRGRQRTVRAMTAEGVDPIRAACPTGGVWDAAEAAVFVLAADRTLRIADDGGLRLASRRRGPRDPILAAFLRGMEGAIGVKVHQIPDPPRFEEFRALLLEQELRMKPVMTTGSSRPLITAFAAMSAFALGLHVLTVEPSVPFEADGRPEAWIFWGLIDWTAMALVSFLLPPDGRRRWPELDAHCREQVERARTAVPERTRHAVTASKHRPPAPEVRRSGDRPNRSWADDIGIDTCGGCGGGE
ncbi:hypothetical protein ACWGBV_01790 [Streptomyces sp. NPDC055051]